MEILSKWEAPVVVHWLDAVVNFRQEPGEARLVEQITIGWAFLGEEEHGARVVVLVHSQDENGFGENTVVPASQVVRIETLDNHSSWEGESLKDALLGDGDDT